MLLTAVVGGGFSLKGVKIPKVGSVPRAAASIVGLASIGLGLHLHGAETARESISAQAAQADARAAEADLRADQGGPSDDTQPTAEVAAEAAKRSPIGAPAAEPTSVAFTIADDLGSELASKQSTLIINGKNVGTIVVNKAAPQAELTVTVARSGAASYTVRSSASQGDGEGAEFAGTGQGIIEAAPGKRFELQGDVHANPWLVTLVERSAAATPR